MTFIHGGAFIYGSGNRSVYDMGKLVSQSVKIGKPVVGINFNYRVGFCGFLASRQIRDELEADGLPGNGNFGLSDQRLALEWIHRYIDFCGGSSKEVTIFGCSAGGISVSLHCASKNPPPFQRAISMSGCGLTLPIWTSDQHQKIYDALAKAMHIDSESADSLNQLRSIPESKIAGAMSLVHGIAAPSCLPCDDGYLVDAQALWDPQRESELLPPSLKAYMIGDCFDEGVVFCYDIEVDNNDYAYLRKTLTDHLKSSDVDKILAIYNAGPELQLADIQRVMWRMTGDAMFAIPAWLFAHRSRQSKTYAYHFDQQSTMPGDCNGLAHHAHDLMYLFGNWAQEPTPSQTNLMMSLQNAYVRFAYGEEPWEEFQLNHRWKIWGPNDGESLESEEEGEAKRRYSRLATICKGGLWPGFFAAMDEVGVKRSKIGSKIQL